MFPSIIGYKPSGIHPGGGLGSGQRLRSGNCHSCLPHLRLPSNCTSHQVYEFTVPLFLTFQKYVTWSVLFVWRNAVKALQILSLALLAKLIDLQKQKKRLEISTQQSAIPFLRSDKLTHQMLPMSVAENLKYGRPTSEMFESATVLFSEVRSSLWDSIFPCFWACISTMNHILFSWTSSFPRLTGSTTLHGPAALLSSLRCWTWSTRLLMHGWTNTTCTRQGQKHKYKYQPYMSMK